MVSGYVFKQDYKANQLNIISIFLAKKVTDFLKSPTIREKGIISKS